MRNIKFLAGIAAILIFTAIIFFKAARPGKRHYSTKEGDNLSEDGNLKLFPLLLGITCLAAGIWILIKAIRLV